MVTTSTATGSAAPPKKSKSGTSGSARATAAAAEARKPARVMPIWMVDRNWLGSRASWATCLPAKAALTTTSTSTSPSSTHGPCIPHPHRRQHPPTRRATAYRSGASWPGQYPPINRIGVTAPARRGRLERHRSTPPPRIATSARISTTTRSPTIKASSNSALPVEGSGDPASVAGWESWAATCCSDPKVAGEGGASARPVRSASNAARISLPRTAYSPIASWRSWTVRSSSWRLPNQATVGRSGSTSAPVETPSTRPTKLPSTGSHPTATSSSGSRLGTTYHTVILDASCGVQFTAAVEPTPLPGHAGKRYPIGLDACPRLSVWCSRSGEAGRDRSTREDGSMGVDDKAKNKTEELKGQAKEGLGRATDDDELQVEGQTDQAKSDLKQAGEQVKDAFKD